jgi:glycosyltransferase involved in cell wall biosynthesis
MHALVVFHLGGVTGPGRSLGQAARLLAERGSVEFVVPERGATEEEYRALGPVSVLPYSALTYARGAREGLRLLRRLGRDVRMFRRELRRRRPDLVVAVTTVLPAVLLAARRERVPVVVYAAEVYEQRWKSAPLLRLWGALLAAGTAALADGVVCCSQLVASQFPRWIRTPLTVAYPPVGQEYEGGRRPASRALYGVEEADPCIAVIGSISRGRGQDVALRALARLRELHPDARLLIVGEPHPRAVDLAFADELRALTAGLGLEGAVVFARPTHAMADVYAAADIVVNPARFAEPFGRVAPEALMAGRPVVASRVGAIPEVVRDGVDGLLVEPGDPDALAAAVTRLAGDPDHAARLVQAGRGRVIERFGYKQDLAAWRAVLDQAAQ